MMRPGPLAASFLLFFLATACGPDKNDPQSRAERLGRLLRCPVCRGVSIGESPSALAREMMETVQQQIRDGKTDDEILAYFEDRYGEWILLAPKASGVHLAVWILPLLFLGGGGVLIGRLVTKREKGDEK